MRIEDEEAHFESSGRVMYVAFGIFGLDGGGVVTDGYDGTFWNPSWKNDSEPLTRAELQEVADFMIDRWQRWRVSLSAGASSSEDG